jgi:hypothetical protein
LRVAQSLCVILILQLCTGFTTAQQPPLSEQSQSPTLQQSQTPTPQPSPSAIPSPQPSETATPTPQPSQWPKARPQQTPIQSPKESETPTAEQSIPPLQSPLNAQKENAVKNESAVPKEKETEFSILYWTLVFTIIGVLAGWIALFFGLWTLIYARKTILDAQQQARENAKMSKAQFWILLRGVFAWYDDVHANFRPGGPWYMSDKLPSAPADFARAELYMGLFEYCDLLLEEGLIDERDFEKAYAYRLANILMNDWVVTQKLKNIRDGWLAFVNICHRLPKVAEIRRKVLVDSGFASDSEYVKIPVEPLNDGERAKLYPKKDRGAHKRSNAWLKIAKRLFPSDR